MLACFLRLSKSVMHFPITVLQSAAHSQSPEQGKQEDYNKMIRHTITSLTRP